MSSTAMSTASYADLTLPPLERTDITTDHQGGELAAITLTRAVAALLAAHGTPPTAVRFAGRPEAIARYAFTTNDEYRAARLSWARDRFAVFVDDSGYDLALLRLDRCRDQLAAAINPSSDPAASVTTLQQHGCAELLAAGLARAVNHERILFEFTKCAGCGAIRGQVRSRDRLCPTCRGDRPPLPEPVESLAEAEERGIIAFLDACYPRRLAELQRRERDGHQLPLFPAEPDRRPGRRRSARRQPWSQA